MDKKYELVASDFVQVGERRLFRIRALRDFGDVRRGDLGGFIECEENLDQGGEFCWVGDAAQVYGPRARVRQNGRVSGEAWVLGIVEGNAHVTDLAVIGEGVRVGGETKVVEDRIVRGPQGVQPRLTSVMGGAVRRLRL